MKHTAIPSVKGQVTIPADIREKYKISQETPVIIEDKGKGLIMLQVMRLVAHKDADIEYYENGKEIGLNFKHGIDPQIIIDAIKETDG